MITPAGLTGHRSEVDHRLRSALRGRGAHVAAVISSPDLGVLAVAAAGVLCAFCSAGNALSEHCLRRRSRSSRLVVDDFRTKWRRRERCSATCLRRRRPGQVRNRQRGLQITADMHDDLGRRGGCSGRTERVDLLAAIHGGPMPHRTRRRRVRFKGTGECCGGSRHAEQWDGHRAVAAGRIG
jgi:hypothetical protein